MAEEGTQKELVSKELTAYTLSFKIKGRIMLPEDEFVIPVKGADEFLEIEEASIFDKEGARSFGRARKLEVRLSDITMYYFEEFALPKAR